MFHGLLPRRQLLAAAGLGLLGFSRSGFAPLARAAEDKPAKQRRHCVVLWMTGGPTQTDTFDMKPGHANGGEFREVETAAAGLKFSEHLPKLGKLANHLAVVRSLSTKEGDHGRGTYLMRTGHQPQGPIQYPGLGASLSKALGSEDDAVPQHVAIAPYRAFNPQAFGAGFLGPKYAPLTVGASDSLQPPMPGAMSYAEMKVDDLAPPSSVNKQELQDRLELWRALQTNFLANHPGPVPLAQNTVYQRAIKLMDSKAAEAFDLSQEKAVVRDAYGRGRFGQGCLMARRLIERGVSFVEVSLGDLGGNSIGWDTHLGNFAAVKSLSAELDNGWGTLMEELKDRGLLESTTILWMGEFGRTPKINPQGGRDHFPAAWSCVLAGGGIKGGQAFGKTSASGEEVEEGKVDVGDVLATLCTAVGIDPEAKNISDQGRPIKLAEGKGIKEILA
ncbi:DUF1501 domain-containing protein [Anatilimnocola floriformis]|uniref:DUF1501 domain-containing protein n=1 Tax=Anatilimnocola floriformis TaxID=2948575 RepID=UPI0020C4F4F5|nr:DUF1501 domain-containing protein [Anatilimnocola floriformis]